MANWRQMTADDVEVGEDRRRARQQAIDLDRKSVV